MGCGVVDRVQDGRELGSLKQAFKGSGSKWGSWLVAGTGVLKGGVESPKAVPQSAGGIQTGASPVRRSWDSNHANHRHEKGGRSDALSSPIQEKTTGLDTSETALGSCPGRPRDLGAIRQVPALAEFGRRIKNKRQSPRLSPSAMPAQTKAHGMEMQGVNAVKDTANHSARKILANEKIIGSGLIYL